MKRFLKTCAAAFALLLICTFAVSAEDAADNVTWTLDADGTLTVSCEGICNGVPLTEEQWKAVKTIVFTEGVTEIGDWTFDNYSDRGAQYTSVILPEGVERIGRSAFCFVEELSEIVLPSTLTEIGYGAFCCTGLTSVVIPEGVTRIEEATFERCPLISVVIPDTVTSIGAYAFRDTLLTEVRLPASLSELGSAAFACSSLSAVVLPEGLREIGSFAFWFCTRLTEVHLPASLTNIGRSAFRGCSADLRFTVAEGSESFLVEDGVLFSRDKKTLIRYPAYQTETSYTVPAGVEVIREGAFSGCKALSEIILPEGLKEIGGMLFTGCENLKSITLPESVSEVQAAGAIPGVSQFFGTGSYGCGPFYGSSIQEITVLGRETNIIIAWVHGEDGFAKGTTIYCYPYSATDVELRFNGLVALYEDVQVSYLEEDHEHVWTEEQLREPTCDEYGEKRRTCTVCGYAYNEPIPLIAHTYGTPKLNSVSWVREEHVEYICTVCGHSEVKKVLDIEHEHVWTEEILREATCAAIGQKLLICTICNKWRYADIPKTDHPAFEDRTISATCYRAGQRCKVCTACAYYEVLEEFPQTAHTFGELKVITPATCTEDGAGERMCRVCLCKQSETIPATGHSYGEWTQTVAPTLQAVGEEQCVCTACGDVQTREVPKLELSEVAVPYVLAADAVLVLALVILVLKKKKK